MSIAEPIRILYIRNDVSTTRFLQRKLEEVGGLVLTLVQAASVG